MVYQKYCEAMSNLSLVIMELLGMSLGVGRGWLREFFEENNSIMRLNYYPPCQKPDLTLGTGPHCDPTSLTILHQHKVGGLQVYVDDEWHSITPNFDAFVVNIGDTFMVRYFKFWDLTHATNVSIIILGLICSYYHLTCQENIKPILFFFFEGSFKWEIQKLLAQGSGEQQNNKEVSSFLLVSKK